jgi:hypothetical protein
MHVQTYICSKSVLAQATRFSHTRQQDTDDTLTESDVNVQDQNSVTFTENDGMKKGQNTDIHNGDVMAGLGNRTQIEAEGNRTQIEAEGNRTQIEAEGNRTQIEAEMADKLMLGHFWELTWQLHTDILAQNASL